MRLIVTVLMVGLVALLASPALATTINGANDVGDNYGAPLAVQDTPTGFGDNQSELDAAYATLDGSGNLSLLLTGNLQDGGNGLVIFVDSRAGGAIASTQGDGSGVIGSVGGARTDDWGTDTDGGAGVSPTPGGGSILDPGFNPDVSMEINISGGTYYTNIIDLTAPNDDVHPDKDLYLGSNTLGAPSVTQTYTRSDADAAKGSGGTIEHAFDDSNSAGVNGYDFGTPPGPLGDPLTATTGYEALVSSAFLANDGQPIRIMAFITNNDGSYLSNQFLGEAGLAGATNLAGPGGDGGTPLFDATLFAGNQHFTVVPEPSTLVLAGLVLAGLAFTRRRK